MTFQEWSEAVPEEIRQDVLWQLELYRHSLFLSDLAWHDANLIMEQRWYSLADQLFRASSSISANLEEGYSRPTATDRTRFYGIAFGSARESRGWYFKARHLLGDDVMSHRIDLLSRIIRQLIGLMKSEGRHIKENSAPYPHGTDPNHAPL